MLRRQVPSRFTEIIFISGNGRMLRLCKTEILFHYELETAKQLTMAFGFINQEQQVKMQL